MVVQTRNQIRLQELMLETFFRIEIERTTLHVLEEQRAI